MKKKWFSIFSFIAVLSLAVTACGGLQPLVSNDSGEESAEPGMEAVASQGEGPTVVTGSVAYTDLFFTMGVAEPIVILEDQGGFVTRDRKFLIPTESQVMGQITSDFYTSPFTYSLTLPAVPSGTLHDVDNDGETDTGVMIFAVAYWTNTWGDPYLERRDQGGGGWSSAYASTRVSTDSDSFLEVFGGQYLVYAPDANQQFPSDFGTDEKLFTEDDPMMDLPAGWSMIDMDQSPFVIDRSENPTLDLYEPESSALDDFSDMSYTEAFDAMLEKFRNEYAFTEYKNVDWDARDKEFRPRFEEAEKANDAHLFALALRDFLWSIPDTHVGMDTSALNADFSADIAGGIGIALGETSDGQIVVRFVTPGGPAEEAGVQFGAQVTALDGAPIDEFVSAVVPWSSPFSNPEIKRLQQLRYATRFRADKEQVELTFINPGGSEQTVALDVVAERDSFGITSFYAGEPATSLPVDFEILPSGYGYIKITSFSENQVLSIQAWEYALQYFIDNEVPGVILDMRHNGGGSGWLADQMAAYFFKEETIVGKGASYDDVTGEFYMDPASEALMLPPREGLQYSGPVVVMVGPACVSACEFFSYAMTVNDRAIIVGEYPTSGAGGGVEAFLMPGDTYVQLTVSRQMDADGNIHIEGGGVAPDVRVPVTVETFQRELEGEDVILEAAEKVISQPKGAGVTPSAPPKIATQAESENAFAAGAKFVEDKKRETYTDAELSSPGVLTYTVPLAKSETLIWAYYWCTTTTEILDQNFSQIEVQFELNGQVVPLDQFAVNDLPAGGNQCRIIYTALSDWQTGENTLKTSVTFKSKINDGMGDYEAGDYVSIYSVFVP
ncbi:MAG: peptidase S41 [Anaerolineales bacterium]|nr:peptidase S41 [Anaerolineales bacterium]